MAQLPHYGRILLATDGSGQAEQAARHGVALARQLGAEVLALYVVDTHLAFNTGIHRQEALEELREEGRRALAAVVELARGTEASVRTSLCDGRPGEVIIYQSTHLPADLIVMGSHGHGSLAELLLGSVTQYVIHHAHVPVCIVRPSDEEIE